MFAADEASRNLGIELLEHGEGTAVLRMTVTPRYDGDSSMVNGHGIAHGGYLFLLADTAFACACNSHGPVTAAAGADIAFVAPAHVGDVLVASAEERTRFGRSGIYDVTLRRGGAVIAEFRGRSRSIRAAAPENTDKCETAHSTTGSTTKESR
ncbi:hydroxyphenylacetyl-CoA thioesterase PaaI [Streptomyces cavernae]|uniref:hydroxyphenylacetyl-CoA thioesterase PaaI n=1 Tax=Streptomyces cavernae TaxID=2259034 RepID=UPI000FEBC310|nr:hydroxyphenylacetyl-CoA thioesterase PaaI [Streptomyces cavernae]